MKKLDAVADRGMVHPRNRLQQALELSPDLKAFAAALVNAKVPGDPKLNQAARGWAWHKVRTTLGVAAARSNARIKLDGLRWCGPGGEEAYGRRKANQEAADARRAAARALYNARHHVVHSSLPPR